MSTFALIHGGGHGGWCWELVIPELEARGHSAVAPDLPIDDPGPGLAAYAQIVVRAIGDSVDDVVVVGHSLGGLVVPLVAEVRPVRHMIFLGSFVPAPGEVYGTFVAGEPDAMPPDPTAAPYDERGVRPARPWKYAREVFYADVDEDLARRAWQRLRPQSATLLREPSPLRRWPDAPSSYIVMADDRAINASWCRRMARERLGVEPIELPGGHSPFLSRPAHLARLLDSVASDGL